MSAVTHVKMKINKMKIDKIKNKQVERCGVRLKVRDHDVGLRGEQ